MRADTFECWFVALTGTTPFSWQRKLFTRLVDRDVPRVLDLPTGLGKTSVLPIWLLALAAGASLPRRLVYVVNRRTVVDQATEVVERIRERLRDPGDDRWVAHERALKAVARRLQALSACRDENEVLGVSTLRGELADNQEWKADPARPAIIVGTIDMIGSKLLFSGYGDGRYLRVHHAGLIGQDAMIVHDEAHLTPAFSDLLRAAAAAQRDARELRPVQVLELSATQRDPGGDGVLSLTPEDLDGGVVRARLTAKKHLRLHEVDRTEVIASLVELARQHDRTPSKVLIYVRLPEDAQRVAKGLRRRLGSGADERVALLTGTIRGYERDQLVHHNAVYRALLDHGSKVDQTVYLVSTSAGEVGIDLDSDHVVSDVTTLDAMVQRLGRVNRRGGRGREASVDVVARRRTPEEREPADEIGRAIQHTEAVFKRWADESGGIVDVCPRNLRKLLTALSPEERQEAFSPKPDTSPLTEILLDAWSLTSIDEMPGRPEVVDYLHGLTHDPPETYIVWRKEVSILAEAQVDGAGLREWFRACRVEARERLRDRTERVRKSLTDLLRSHRKKEPECDFRGVVLDERGAAEWRQLSEIVDRKFGLAYRTVVLPVEAGGLDENGMLDPTVTAARANLDVAEEGAGDDRRERWLHVRGTETGRYERLLTGEQADVPSEGLREQRRIVLDERSEHVDSDGKALDLVLLASPRKSALEDPEAVSAQQTLTRHSGLAGEHMQRIADRLGLEGGLRDALVTAAHWHDRGKDRQVWQRYACNEGGAEALAKSRRYGHPRVLGRYRHEFGSVLDAAKDLNGHPEPDLILHLIAAHHGWARPHFEPESSDNAYTTADNAQASVEAMRRFGRCEAT